mmetsp:Transcript_37459/g.99758  ORF Transcript_37459/g.99758 Transcript_37459/m.99758 type:complete len:337 (+) Transcript_37459:495-1505(+)
MELGRRAECLLLRPVRLRPLPARLVQPHPGRLRRGPPPPPHPRGRRAGRAGRRPGVPLWRRGLDRRRVPGRPTRPQPPPSPALRGRLRPESALCHLGVAACGQWHQRRRPGFCMFRAHLRGRGRQAVPLRWQTAERRADGDALLLRSGRVRVGSRDCDVRSAPLSSLRPQHGRNARPNLHTRRLKRAGSTRRLVGRHVRVRPVAQSVEVVVFGPGGGLEPGPSHSARAGGVQGGGLRFRGHHSRCRCLPGHKRFIFLRPGGSELQCAVVHLDGVHRAHPGPQPFSTCFPWDCCGGRGALRVRREPATRHFPWMAERPLFIRLQQSSVAESFVHDHD